MDSKENIQNRFGVPTSLMLVQGDRTEAQAIRFAVNGIRSAGFKAIEISPGQFRSVAGSAAEVFLKDAFREGDRKNLGADLEPFHTVTVHGSNIIIRVPGGGEEAKEETWRPYLELMSFGRDIGAELVTFHPLQAPEGVSLKEEEMALRHIEFGRIAAEYAEKWDLLAGFELATQYRFFLNNGIIERIGSKRFGILLDLGHLALHFPDSAHLTESVLQVAEDCIDETLEYHAGGVQLTSQGLREHRPLDKHNILDHAKLMDLVKRKYFRGTIVFEIFFQTAKPEQAPASFEENLEVCMAAKRELLSGYP